MKTRRIASITAAVAVVLAMVGAGVYASWSEHATASQNLEVGTFGMRIVAATAGAEIAPDGKSVTYTVPEIQVSAPSSAPFDFTVELVGEIPARVEANVTSPPLAPFTSLPVVPDGDTVLHQGEQVMFTAGIQWPELEVGDLGKVTSVTYTIVATEGPPRPVLAEPTAVQKSCSANDGGINIPAVAGVDYSIDGVLASAGFHQLNVGTYAVTAAAQAGFDPVLVGYPAGGWSLQVAQDPACVDFTLSGSTVYATTYAYVTGTPPVVDPVAHTLTWTFDVSGANGPTFTNCGPLGCGVPFWIGRWDASIPEASIDVISATATVSPSLAAQANKISLKFRSTAAGSFPVLGTLPLSIANLRSTQWGLAVGGHHATDDGLGVTWSGLTGGVTGTVTVVMQFSATA